ncbi:3-oxoacyl-[acyl-carrier-protein] synthase III [Streptomyces glebosus]|uniref:3-oxoacyl-[acyl-carrier-protein] synthase III n=1 Tax=Streptomyces glebosus TaxID=249580 RepID=A0A640SU52_9ACTN|nr:3-oxoacyl-ACP synthase III family protein [Streptomyces glebosus]GFE13626.1 3-oxoacyl-[acyl-carrier-protein] synthase III [Streptomyces glebosus]GHG69091.1 3-oxoacyl-[acyl-carrier-protein] synthase III [Streptomyces glebosus]
MAVPQIRIGSVATKLPGPPVDNARLGTFFRASGVFEQWVDTFIGTRTRHLSMDLDTGEVRFCLADLAEEAGRKAMKAAGLAPGDIDLVIMSTSMPDTLLPTTVNVVADRLGIDGVASYQLQSGCTGAMQAMDIAHQMLLTGRHRTALVIGGEMCAKHIDLDLDFGKLSPGELVNTVLFGDGAGAAVLTAEAMPGTAVLHRVLVQCVGHGKAPGQIVEWFGMGDREKKRSALYEDFKAIEENVPLLSAEALKELLDGQGWRAFDVAWLLPPQLSARMTDRIVSHLALPQAQEISCVAETGNTANALPFFQLERALPRMKAGDRAVAVAVESSKWIKSGFALEMA